MSKERKKSRVVQDARSDRGAGRKTPTGGRTNAGMQVDRPKARDQTECAKSRMASGSLAGLTIVCMRSCYLRVYGLMRKVDQGA